MKNQSGLFLGLVLLVFFYSKSYSQNLYHSGLLFTAAPSPKEQRTSLDLTHDSPVTARNKFTLEFDFAIWSRNQFGYIFRIFDKDHHNIDLVYIPESSTLAVLKLVINGLPTTINIALAEKDLVRNNWMHLSLTFDLNQGRVDLRLDNQSYTDDNVDAARLRRLYICFGVNRSIYFPTTDVPHMAIRNIWISDHKNQPRHSWLLNESEGETASDLTGNSIAQIINPTWLVNNHFFWTKRDEFHMEASSGVACDTVRNRILLIGKNRIVSYDVNTSETHEQIVNNVKPSGLKTELFYYSALLKKIYCIGTIPNQIHVYDEGNNVWEKGVAGSFTAQCINSAFFLNEQNEAAFSLGGYRNYRYFDNLMRYSFRDKSWNQVLLKGDKLVPRSYAAVTKTNSPGEYLVFGGYGNASGQQELGPQCLYDLYRLNINDGRLEKQWNMLNVAENFIPMGSVTVTEQNPALYVLGFPPFLNGTYLKLYRISIEKPGYSVVSDTIHFYFDEVRSKASLFFFRKTQEFYAVIKTPISRDSTSYKIFSLNYPPVSRSMMSTTLKTVLANPGTWISAMYWMVGVLLMFLIYLLVWLLKKLHDAQESLEAEDQLNSLVGDRKPFRSDYNDKNLTELPQQNAIYLFGEFRIYDADGLDISHHFSTKLRQLFLSVLLMGSDEKGITNEKLNSIHWTYHSPESAKNNRNVNLKKLRDLLTNLKGVQISHLDGSWLLRLSPDVFCDYHYLQKKIKSGFQPLNRGEFERIIHLLAQGIFVPDERMPWLDPFSSQFLTALLDYLFLLTDSFEKDKNPEAIYRIANIILKCDPLNEEAFKLKIEALVMLKNHNQAFLDYEYFTRGYEKMYGIQFPLSFKSFFRKEE